MKLCVTLTITFLFTVPAFADDPMNVGVVPVNNKTSEDKKEEKKEQVAKKPKIDKDSPEYRGGFAGGCEGALAGIEAHFRTKAPANICHDPAKFEAWKQKLEKNAEAQKKARLEREAKRKALEDKRHAEQLEKERLAEEKRKAEEKKAQARRPLQVREEVVHVKIVPEVVKVPVPEGEGTATSFTPPSSRMKRREQGLWDGSVSLGTKAMPGAVSVLIGGNISLPFMNDKWFDIRYMFGNAWVDKRQDTVNRFASDFLAAVRFRNNLSAGLSLTWAGKPANFTSHYLAGATGAYQWNMGKFSLRPELTLGYNGSKIRSIGDGLRAAGGIIFTFHPL